MPITPPYNQPLPAVLPDLVTPGFEVRMNQIVRLLFQLDGNSIATVADFKDQDTWDTLIAASDVTKVVVSPLFSMSKVPASKALEVGPDTNVTYRGLPEYFGEGVSRVTATFRGKDAASMNSLSLLTQFSLMNSNGLSTLRAYWVNNDGHMFANKVGLTFVPILMYNFSLRSRGSDGLNSNDVIEMSWDLEPNWDSLIVPVIPSFDPRTL